MKRVKFFQEILKKCLLYKQTYDNIIIETNIQTNITERKRYPIMTRKEMKQYLIDKMGVVAFTERFEQLKNWNTVTGALEIMMKEIKPKEHSVEESESSMFRTYYEIG